MTVLTVVVPGQHSRACPICIYYSSYDAYAYRREYAYELVQDIISTVVHSYLDSVLPAAPLGIILRKLRMTSHSREICVAVKTIRIDATERSTRPVASKGYRRRKPTSKPRQLERAESADRARGTRLSREKILVKGNQRCRVLGGAVR